MTIIGGKSGIKSITWEAVITRADGTIEDLGVIAEYHRNPWTRFKRWLAR